MPSDAERRLLGVLVLTGGFMAVEFLAGLLTGSLAILADAGHMLRDVIGVFAAWLAARLASRPADPKATYGYRRYEILAGFTNALLLLGLVAYIAIDALRRLSRPEPVDDGVMIGIGILGLLVNLIGMALLQGHARESLNLRGAYLEVLADALGSLGVLIAGLGVRLTGWVALDSLVAVAIALWILPRSLTLLRDATRILLEAVPEGIDIAAIRAELADLEGVREVHDLHVWAVSDGYPLMTVHLVAERPCPAFPDLIRTVREIAARHGIAHVTVQVEPVPLNDAQHP